MNNQLSTAPRIIDNSGDFRIPNRMPKTRIKTLIPKREVNEQVHRLGKRLAIRLKEQVGKQDLVIIAIMMGGDFLAVDIERLVGEGRFGLRTTKHCMFVKRIPGTESVPEVVESVRTFQKEDIQSRHVVIIDDIVETGTTLRHAIDVVNGFAPESVQTLSLLWKPDKSLGNFRPNWCCFKINNVNVCGYGMDHFNGRYRNLQRVVWWPGEAQFGEYTPIRPEPLD